MIAILVSAGISGCENSDIDKAIETGNTNETNDIKNKENIEFEHTEDLQTLKKLYGFFKNGEIIECKLNGQTVYYAGLNAHDAGGTIFDKDGEIIGGCSYAWGNVDAICEQLTEHNAIYRIVNNIWGLPAADKYGLGFIKE